MTGVTHVALHVRGYFCEQLQNEHRHASAHNALTVVSLRKKYCFENGLHAQIYDLCSRNLEFLCYKPIQLLFYFSMLLCSKSNWKDKFFQFFTHLLFIIYRCANHFLFLILFIIKTLVFTVIFAITPRQSDRSVL